MDAKQLLDLITANDILTLMSEFNIPYRTNNNPNEILFQTVCHGGDSHKLYFYIESKTFHCYTNCGTMNIIDLVQKIKGYDFSSAISFLTVRFNLGFKEGFDDDAEVTNSDFDLDIINRYNEYISVKGKEEPKPLEVLDENILNKFNNLYHKSFINDGISIKTMKKYDIKLDIYDYRIIIPHRDSEGNLIAIRSRNLDEELVEKGLKYTPIYIDGKFLSAPISRYLYGLDKNKDIIKSMRKIILFESEKSVMQFETMFENSNFSVALCSSNLSNYHIDIIKDLGVEEVIIALDKEFNVYGSDEEKLYARKVRKSMIDRLNPYFRVSVIWDRQGLIGYKESPTDNGRNVFMELYKNRIVI